MKKILFIFTLAFTLQLSAQDKTNWLKDNTTALEQAEVQNKPILVFVTDNPNVDASAELRDICSNNSNLLNKITSNAIMLMLDVSDKKSYNTRLAMHYTKQDNVRGLSLVDRNGNTIIEPLVDFDSTEKVLVFLTLLNDKL